MLGARWLTRHSGWLTSAGGWRAAICTASMTGNFPCRVLPRSLKMTASMCDPTTTPKWTNHNFEKHFREHPGDGAKERLCWRECLQKSSDVDREDYRKTSEEVYSTPVVVAKERWPMLVKGAMVTKRHFVDRRGIRVIVNPTAGEFDTCHHLHDRFGNHLNPHIAPWSQRKVVIENILTNNCIDIRWRDRQATNEPT